MANNGAAISNRKTINLALQGGGAHGAFGWGVMDKFLEDGRLDIEGICGTSAGSMNAVVYAYGKLKGNDGAREALHNFWKGISESGQKFKMPKMPWDFGMPFENPLAIWMKAMMGAFSPYQLNPMNYNPLREVLEQHVDFEELHRNQDCTKLFICATNVRTG
jgi:NTE family protein